MASSPRELRLDVGSLTLAARAWGPTDGVPVLGLHGWLDNAATFDRLAPMLPASVQLVALDLAGHGLSDHIGADAFGYHFVDWIPQVLAAADALGWTRFSLLGHSMGAAISSFVAAAAPDRIERATLIEGLGSMSRTAEETPAGIARAIADRPRVLAREHRGYPDLETAASVRAQQPNAEMTVASARLLVERGMAERDGQHYWRFDQRHRIPSMLRLTEPQQLAMLEAIRAPVLLIVAEDGWPFDRAAQQRRLERVRQIELVTLPGRHHLHLDTPELLAERVGAFLLGEPPTAPKTASPRD